MRPKLTIQTVQMSDHIEYKISYMIDGMHCTKWIRDAYYLRAFIEDWANGNNIKPNTGADTQMVDVSGQ